MRLSSVFFCAACLLLISLWAAPSHAQLYSQDFDIDDTANWTINLSPDTDSSADIFFDYSTVGIPSAPNSTGGSTRGLRMDANLFSGTFGGMSVSPTGQDFTGDYVLSYDMWQSYHGTTFVPADPPFDAGGGIIQGASSGGTNLGYGGILTSGTVANSAGTSDGVWFAATGDGDSAADWRTYSSNKAVSYQPNHLQPTDPSFDERDLDATYLAVGGSAPADFDVDNDVDGNDFLIWQRGFGQFDGDGGTNPATNADGDAFPAFTGDGFVDGLDLEAWQYWSDRGYKTRNAGTSTLYTDNFGGENATAAQEALFPTKLTIDPANVTDVGVIGYAWHQHTVTKIGDIVTWAVDGVDLIEVDMTNFTTPVGGSNILFGHGDINNGSPDLLVTAGEDATELLFTLVDNVQVTAIAGVSAVPEPGSLLLLVLGIGCLAIRPVASRQC